MNDFGKVFVIWLAIIAIIGGGILIFLQPGSTATDTSKNQMTEIKSLEGKPAPKFSLWDSSGTLYSNENLKGKNVILFFSEGIKCYPACWDQIRELGKDSRFNQNDTVALSVVTDQPDLWKGAEEKMPEITKAKIVFDTTSEISRSFQMLIQLSSMHQGTLPGHSYVLINKEGIVKYAFDDIRMGVRNNDLATFLSKLN